MFGIIFCLICFIFFDLLFFIFWDLVFLCKDVLLIWFIGDMGEGGWDEWCEGRCFYGCGDCMCIDDEEKECLMGFERLVDFRLLFGWIVDDVVCCLFVGLGWVKLFVKVFGGLFLFFMWIGKGEFRELLDWLGLDRVFFCIGMVKLVGFGIVVEDWKEVWDFGGVEFWWLLWILFFLFDELELELFEGEWIWFEICCWWCLFLGVICFGDGVLFGVG